MFVPDSAVNEFNTAAIEPIQKRDKVAFANAVASSERPPLCLGRELRPHAACPALELIAPVVVPIISAKSIRTASLLC